LKKSIEQSAKELTTWQKEFRIKLTGDLTITALGSATSQQAPDGSVIWYGFITDITGLKKSKEKINHLSQAVDQSPVSIIITDTFGSIE